MAQNHGNSNESIKHEFAMCLNKTDTLRPFGEERSNNGMSRILILHANTDFPLGNLLRCHIVSTGM
jgi:hypothetical protein